MKVIPEVHPLVVRFVRDCVLVHAAQNVLDRVETHVMDVLEDVKIRASANAWMVVPIVVKIHVYLIAQTVVQADAKVNAQLPALQFAHPHVQVHVKRHAKNCALDVKGHVNPLVREGTVETLVHSSVDVEAIAQANVVLTARKHVEDSALMDVKAVV